MSEKVLHDQEIGRNHPWAGLLGLDKSGSTQTKLANGKSISEMVVTMANNVIDGLRGRAVKGKEIRRYYQIGAFFYSTDMDGNPIVESVFPWTQEPMPWIDEIALHARLEERIVKGVDPETGEEVDQKKPFPVFIENVPPDGGTPMGVMYEKAYEILKPITEEHQDCNPASFLNVSDGFPTPLPGQSEEEMKKCILASAERIKSLKTEWGNVLVWNLLFSPGENPPILFPSSSEGLSPEEQLMYECASEVPEVFYPQIEQTMKVKCLPGARCLGLYLDVLEFARILKIGTRLARLE